MKKVIRHKKGRRKKYMSHTSQVDQRYLIALGIGLVLMLVILGSVTGKEATGETRSKASEPLQQQDLLQQIPAEISPVIDTTMTDDQGHDLDLSHY
jgi:hypothetical protein